LNAEENCCIKYVCTMNFNTIETGFHALRAFSISYGFFYFQFVISQCYGAFTHRATRWHSRLAPGPVRGTHSPPWESQHACPPFLQAAPIAQLGNISSNNTKMSGKVFPASY
jgi:hypothetical protein